MNNIKFGMNIAKLRKVTGLTQKELAQKLNVTDKAVSRWERGVGFPDISSLCPLAEALGVKVSKLLDAEDDDEELINENLLQINGMLAAKDLKKSKIFLWLVSLVLIIVLILTAIFGIKYYKWNYENTIEIQNKFKVVSKVRMKYVEGYKAVVNGEYISMEPIGEVCVVVDAAENYGESPFMVIW